MRRHRRGILPLVLVLSGCYSHAPVRPENVAPGAAVRARITPTRAEQLTEVLGRESRVLQGRLLGPGEGGVLLQVPGPIASGGARLEQRVLLPPSDIVELELRTLDRRRTGGLVALLAAAGGFLMLQQFRSHGEDGVDSGDKTGGGNETLLPLSRLP